MAADKKPSATDSNKLIDWAKVLLPLVISWPAFAVVFLIFFGGPIKEVISRFAQSEGSTAEVGPIKISLGTFVLPPQYRDTADGVGVIITVDLSDSISAVRDQGPLGSTVGYSTAYAVEIMLRQKQVDFKGISARGIYETAKDFDKWDGRDYEGSSLLGALEGLMNVGYYDLSDWPDDIEVRPETAKPAMRISGYTRLDGVDSIIPHLVNEEPVVVSLNVTADFNDAPDGKIVISPDPPIQGGHSICIVGYDDKSKMLKFANSWGTGWGDDGYGYISVNDLKALWVDAFVIKVG